MRSRRIPVTIPRGEKHPETLEDPMKPLPRHLALLLGLALLAACEVPLKKTVKYCWVTSLQFDILDGEPTRVGQVITPWHIDLGSGDLWMAGRIKGAPEQKDVMPQTLGILLRHYNSTGQDILGEYEYTATVKPSGRFKLPKSVFPGLELQQFEQVELFLTPEGGSILTGTEFSFCQNFRRTGDALE